MTNLSRHAASISPYSASSVASQSEATVVATVPWGTERAGLSGFALSTSARRPQPQRRACLLPLSFFLSHAARPDSIDGTHRNLRVAEASLSVSKSKCATARPGARALSPRTPHAGAETRKRAAVSVCHTPVSARVLVDDARRLLHPSLRAQYDRALPFPLGKERREPTTRRRAQSGTQCAKPWSTRELSQRLLQTNGGTERAGPTISNGSDPPQAAG